MYVTYILYSMRLDRYYSGQTRDVTRRLQEHNCGKTRFMERGKPWILVFSKEFKTRTEAIELEKKIKSRGASRFLKDNNISVG